MKFVYADPPYHGMGKKLYDHPEWDKKETHFALVQRLVAEYPDGWVLSCNSKDTRWLLPACPEEAREGVWVKNYHQIRPTTVQFAFEKVIFMGGRKDNKRKPMVRDWIMAPATRLKGLPGAKPPAFNDWVLQLMNYDPTQDKFDDMYPGTKGIEAAVQRATEKWEAEHGPHEDK